MERSFRNLILRSMMYFVFLLKTALFNFSRNKGRTFLTSLGILIGVMSVVLLTAAGLGLKKYIQQQFESFGSNTLRIVPGTVIRNGQFRTGGSSVGAIRFDEKDFNNLKRLKVVEDIAPIFTTSSEVIYGKNKEFGDLYATNEDIFPVLNLELQYGELFTKPDVLKRSKVVDIGPKLAEKLFGKAENAVGNTIKIQGTSFKVIGVLKSKGGGFGGPDLDSFVYLPYRSAYIFNPDKKFLVFAIKFKTGTSIDSIKGDIKEVLLRRYKEDDFSVFEPTQILDALNQIFGTLNIALVAIAAISLVVGGIGIMNIMYVTVTEKTKEIGVRRALGARKNDILFQFLVESVILSLFGGLMGLALSYLIIFAVQSFFPAYVDGQTVALALGISSAIGVIFGVFPAKGAADLSPIDAIRSE
ncbi:ABC transporter permease [Candidatus Woesebacteria bacterium]|nr:ABC transporter permease [Candidatus Woesebacteria bacterium]